LAQPLHSLAVFIYRKGRNKNQGQTHKASSQQKSSALKV